MKATLLIIILFIGKLCLAQIVDIPDVNFKNALLNHNPVIDTNDDGEIQVSEAEALNGIMDVDNYIGQSISDLTGIEAFTNISELLCRWNHIESLDLTNNLNLTAVDCYLNEISEINISNNINLSYLNCGENNLTTLDTSNTSLTSLDCNDNELTSLIVPNSIVHLYCNQNNLTTLDLSNRNNLFELFCSENFYLTHLDITGCTSLYWLHFEYNTNLTTLDLTNVPNLVQLEIVDNGLSSLDISQQPNLEVLYCGNNQLNEVDLTNNSNLMYLGVSGNNLTELDLSNNSYLIQFWCLNNLITSLDLTNNSFLQELRCSGNNMSFLDVRNGSNTNINSFDAQNNPNLTCIFVDDAEYSTDNWTYIDENSTFVETEQECIDLSINNELLNETSIYPNPVKNILYIDDIDTSQQKMIKVYNLLGELTLTKKTTQNKIDVSVLNNGTFMLTIETETGKTTRKIIKY